MSNQTNQTNQNNQIGKTDEIGQKGQSLPPKPQKEHKCTIERLEEIDTQMDDYAYQMGTMIEGNEYSECLEILGELHREKAKLLRQARNEFMAIFRYDQFGDILSVDDAHEVFAGVLHGQSDFTKKFLDEILSNYSVANIEIVEVEEKRDMNKVIGIQEPHSLLFDE